MAKQTRSTRRKAKAKAKTMKKPQRRTRSHLMKRKRFTRKVKRGGKEPKWWEFRKKKEEKEEKEKKESQVRTANIMARLYEQYGETPPDEKEEEEKEEDEEKRKKALMINEEGEEIYGFEEEV